MLRRKPKVIRGQRYRSQQIPAIEWDVVDVFDDPAGMPHARLVLVDDHNTRKTIACAQLLDNRYFIMVAAATPAPA